MLMRSEDRLEEFHKFVGEQLARGDKSSPKQALHEWNERLDALDGIRRGLADVRAGRLRSADEFTKELRENLKHGGE